MNVYSKLYQILAGNTTLKKSHLSQHEADKRFDWHQRRRHGMKDINVESKHLRATQSAIDSKWKPENSIKSPKARGLQTDDGKVHLVDGHHRGNHAKINNNKLKVSVYKHSAQDEKDYKSGK